MHLGQTALNVLDHMVSALVVLDQRFCVRLANPAFEELVDMSQRRMLGLSIRELFMDSSISAKAMAKALKSGTSFTQRDVLLVLHDRKELWVDLDMTPLLDGEFRQDRGLLVELRQVEHHRRMSQENQMLAQHRSARDLIRSLAHEVKNPLGGVRGAAQLLERSLPDPDLREYTQIIIQEVDRLTNVVDRMLGPKSKPRMRWINVHEVVERVRQLVAIELPDGIGLVRDYDPSIPEVYADPDLLIQAMLNIVRNAAQALGESRGSGSILLKTRAQRQLFLNQQHHRLAVRLDIIDDGPGIPDELIHTIFYPMVTGREGGTGLGLSIAQALVNQHQGVIDCESRPGRTVFSIYLPILDEHQTVTQHAAE